MLIKPRVTLGPALAPILAGFSISAKGWHCKPYFHTNFLFSSMGVRSLEAVLGASLTPLPLCLGSVAPQLPSSRLHLGIIHNNSIAGYDYR
jgi:hypothetical protein